MQSAASEPYASRNRRHVPPEEKLSAVLRLIRGENAEQVAESVGVSAYRIQRWENRFLEAGRDALARKHRARAMPVLKRIAPIVTFMALAAGLVVLLFRLLPK